MKSIKIINFSLPGDKKMPLTSKMMQAAFLFFVRCGNRRREYLSQCSPRAGTHTRRLTFQQDSHIRSQQSSNRSKISFCSSVIVVIRVSWCRAMYSIKRFISGVLDRRSVFGEIFPCHNSSSVLLISSPPCSIIHYHQAGDISR